MPTARSVFVPQPVVGRSESELRAYIEGTDPVLKQPFMQGVIEGLTRPLSDEDYKGATFERSTPRFLEPDTEDNLRELFIQNRWTDYLPIILPTEERVERMLKGTKHAADKIVGRLRPTAFREYWEFDVEKVAVNAVMAGARPEYLPVILAMAASGTTARSSSTTSFAAISVVNGPIRNEIGMNSGIGALGPYNHANATIGRAYGLLSQNLQGGSVPGESYLGSLGNFLSYSACFPEAEERSPWAPFHVDEGFRADESTVSIFFGGWYTQSGYGPRETWKEKFFRCLTATDHFSPPLIVMDPLVARGFASSRHQQARAHRMVRGERQAAGARVLGRSIDPVGDPPAGRRRHRAVREPAQGRARRAHPHLYAERSQDRRHGRRDAGGVQDIRRNVYLARPGRFPHPARGRSHRRVALSAPPIDTIFMPVPGRTLPN